LILILGERNAGAELDFVVFHGAGEPWPCQHYRREILDLSPGGAYDKEWGKV
jgi:hypothetical protein